MIDVSQSLEEIQTTRDLVKSTAIALVKQDAVFLPGTTIGATHWVAYAMTRGTFAVYAPSTLAHTVQVVFVLSLGPAATALFFNFLLYSLKPRASPTWPSTVTDSLV